MLVILLHFGCGATIQKSAEQDTASQIDGNGQETLTITDTATEIATETATDTATETMVDCPTDMVLVAGYTFDVGCTVGQADCADNEYPAHSVTVSNDYCIGISEVTQAAYSMLMGNNPSAFGGCEDCPVETISWHDAAAYANARSVQDGLPLCYDCTNGECTELMNPYLCTGYRLPTEAEWEGAARCGQDTLYAGANEVGDVAWYLQNSGQQTHAGGEKAANTCGLFDMSGNVWEWVNDWYGEYISTGGTITNPSGPLTGPSRVYRGGSWSVYPRRLRVSYRYGDPPSERLHDLGFRLVRIR